MNKITNIVRVSGRVEDIENTCDTYWAAGYALASTIALPNGEVVLIFQPKQAVQEG